jgi:hypothetical protein
MDRTLRIILIVLGIVCFVVGALVSFGSWGDGPNASGMALLGFAFWLASTLP